MPHKESNVLSQGYKEVKQVLRKSDSGSLLNGCYNYFCVSLPNIILAAGLTFAWSFTERVNSNLVINALNNLTDNAVRALFAELAWFARPQSVHTFQTFRFFPQVK